jgi:hypothetical protein
MQTVTKIGNTSQVVVNAVDQPMWINQPRAATWPMTRRTRSWAVTHLHAHPWLPHHRHGHVAWRPRTCPHWHRPILITKGVDRGMLPILNMNPCYKPARRWGAADDGWPSAAGNRRLWCQDLGRWAVRDQPTINGLGARPQSVSNQNTCVASGTNMCANLESLRMLLANVQCLVGGFNCEIYKHC